jgi:hypothetical protein
MSLGNKKTQGGKGTNYPWQTMLINAVNALFGNGDDIKNILAGKSKTPNMLRTTTSGTVPGETYSVSVANVGSADGTFLGATIKAGEELDFNAGALNNSFAAGSFAYDATGTEFLIIYIYN